MPSDASMWTSIAAIVVSLISLIGTIASNAYQVSTQKTVAEMSYRASFIDKFLNAKETSEKEMVLLYIKDAAISQNDAKWAASMLNKIDDRKQKENEIISLKAALNDESSRELSRKSEIENKIRLVEAEKKKLEEQLGITSQMANEMYKQVGMYGGYATAYSEIKRYCRDESQLEVELGISNLAEAEKSRIKGTMLYASLSAICRSGLPDVSGRP